MCITRRGGEFDDDAFIDPPHNVQASNEEVCELRWLFLFRFRIFDIPRVFFLLLPIHYSSSFLLRSLEAEEE